MKTLKYEEVYRNEYRDFAEAHTSIGEFLERVYNKKRLHSEARDQLGAGANPGDRLSHCPSRYGVSGTEAAAGAGASMWSSIFRQYPSGAAVSICTSVRRPSTYFHTGTV